MKVLDAQNWTRWWFRPGASYCAKRLFRDGPDQGHVQARQSLRTFLSQKKFHTCCRTCCHFLSHINLLHFSQHPLRPAPSLTYCIFNAEGGEYLVNVVVLQMCFFLDFLFGTVCVLLLALFGRHFIERLIWFSLEKRPLHLVSRFVNTFFT